MSENELQHYGVVGMKWGIRRAKKKGVEYAYKSHGQKKYERRLAKHKTKGVDKDKLAKTKSKLELYKQRDRNRVDYAKKSNTGKSIAKTLLMGPIGAGNYNRLRSSGSGKVGAFLASNILSSTVGAPITIAYSRHREKVQARRDIEMRNRNKKR